MSARSIQTYSAASHASPTGSKLTTPGATASATAIAIHAACASRQRPRSVASIDMDPHLHERGFGARTDEALAWRAVGGVAPVVRRGSAVGGDEDLVPGRRGVKLVPHGLAGKIELEALTEVREVESLVEIGGAADAELRCITQMRGRFDLAQREVDHRNGAVLASPSLLPGEEAIRLGSGGKGDRRNQN